QAEDGIRVRNVTGVQTCALPISSTLRPDTPRRPGPTGLGGAEERGSSASFIAGAAGAADASGCAGVGEGGCQGEVMSPPSDRRCRPSTRDERVSTKVAGFSPWVGRRGRPKAGLVTAKGCQQGTEVVTSVTQCPAVNFSQWRLGGPGPPQDRRRSLP